MPKPIRLTLRQVARAALKAHKEDRLQATTKTVVATQCVYADGKNADGKTICCVIGASIPVKIGRKFGANPLSVLLDRKAIVSRDADALIDLQDAHDQATWARVEDGKTRSGAKRRLLSRLRRLAA